MVSNKPDQSPLSTHSNTPLSTDEGALYQNLVDQQFSNQQPVDLAYLPKQKPGHKRTHS